MSTWLKGFWRGFVEEIFLKSIYGKELGSDTLLRWIICVMVFTAFYCWVYSFDARGVETDKWLHEVFGWRLSDEPSPDRVAWHRLAAGALSGFGIVAGSLDFGVSLYRRIKARIAASNAKLEQVNKTLEHEDEAKP